MNTADSSKIFLHKLPRLLLLILLLAIYFIAGKLGLQLAFFNESATAIWPSTGIALAAFILFGKRVWPAIFLGAFLVNLTTAGTIVTSLGIALGNTLEGVVGAYFVRKFAKGIHVFDSIQNIFKFTFFAAILSTTISANIGVLTLMLGGLTTWRDFLPTWTIWWLGDMGGALIITPLILVWMDHPRIRIDRVRAVHFLSSAISIFIITWVVFSGIVPSPYLYIPIGVWIAFWFGQKGAVVATVMVAALTIFYTLQGIGPFVGDSINYSLLQLQLFLSIFSLTSLIFAATVLAIRKSEKTLASHEHRFQALIEKSSDGVVLIDPSSKIFYASESNKQILGYEPEELVGMTGFDLIVPEDKKMTMHELAKLVLKPGGTVTVEYRTIRKDKRIIWVETTGTNLLFDNNVNAVVINFHDITEKKIAQEKILHEKKRSEAMLKSIGEGIIATDSRGKITMVNQTACDTLRWSKEELMHKMMFDIRMEDEAGNAVLPVDRPMTKSLSFGKKTLSFRNSYYVRSDKTRFPVHLTIAPLILGGNLVGTIQVFHDVTSQKELERAKDEFISLASHELRTPMTAIKGLTSMIIKGDYGPVAAALKRPLNNISVSTERQIHLINDLLDISRLQTSRIIYKVTNFSLDGALLEIVESLQPLLSQNKAVKLELHDGHDSLVQADAEWTNRILGNLIGNAIKYTDKGSVIVTSRPYDDFVAVSIVDTGIGISEDDKKKMFGKFQQMNIQRENKSTGSGLGLYIARETARKMGGDVILEKSIPGKGSTFVFKIPKAGTAYAKKVAEVLEREKNFPPSKFS